MKYIYYLYFLSGLFYTKRLINIGAVNLHNFIFPISNFFKTSVIESLAARDI